MQTYFTKCTIKISISAKCEYAQGGNDVIYYPDGAEKCIK